MEQINCNENITYIATPEENGNVITKAEVFRNGISESVVIPANDAEAVSLSVPYNSGNGDAMKIEITETCQYYEISTYFRKNDLERTYTFTKVPKDITATAFLGINANDLLFKLGSGSFKTLSDFKADLASATVGSVLTIRCNNTSIVDAVARIKIKVQSLITNPFTQSAITIPVPAIDTDVLIAFTEKITSFGFVTSHPTALSFAIRTQNSQNENYTDYPITTIPNLITAITALPAGTNYAVHVHWQYTNATQTGGTITISTGFANGYNTQKIEHLDSFQNPTYRGLTKKALFLGANCLIVRRWRQFEHTQPFTILAIVENNPLLIFQTFNNTARWTGFGFLADASLDLAFTNRPIPARQTFAFSESRGYSKNTVSFFSNNKTNLLVSTFDGSITPRTSASFPPASINDASFFANRKQFANVPNIDTFVAYPNNEIDLTQSIINNAWNLQTVYNDIAGNHTFTATPQYAVNECDAVIGGYRLLADPGGGQVHFKYDRIVPIIPTPAGSSLLRLQIVNKTLTPLQAGIVHNTGDLREVFVQNDFLLDIRVNSAGTAMQDFSNFGYEIANGTGTPTTFVNV